MKIDWIETTLGEFVTLQRGHDLPDQARRFGTVPIIGSAGITGFHDTAIAKGPGVTIGRSGASIGVVTYSPVDYWPHNASLYVIDFHGNDERFAYYFLQSLNFSNFNSGSAQPSLNRNFIHPIKVNIPPLPEQYAIAGILGALDDKIELNRRMNLTLESMARAVYKDMTKNVNEQDSILKYADLLSGGTPSTSVEEYWNGNIEWVSAKDVSNTNGIFLLDTDKKITQAGVDNSATKLLPAKTTIVTARGTVGAYCMLGKPMTMNQTNYGLKSKEGIGDYFVYFTLSEMVEQLKQQSYGTIFDTITTKTFQSTLCRQPPIEIIQNFEDQVTPLIEAILNNQKESRTLANLHDTLLPKLMRGEVRVKVN